MMPLYVHRWGDPAKPLLFCLHGFMGSGADWSTLAYTFGGDYHIVAPDLPGHGRSRPPAGAELTFAGTLAALQALLAGEPLRQQAHLLGYSLGGRLALGLALAAPQAWKGVILEGVNPGLATAEERAARARWDDVMADRLRSEPFEAFLHDWYALPLFATLRDHPAFATLLARRLHNDPQQLARAMRGLGTGRMPSQWDAWQTAQLPALLVAGAQDAKYRAQTTDMLLGNPAALAAIIPNAGHNTHFEQPAHFAAVVGGYLQAQYGRAMLDVPVLHSPQPAGLMR